jgi:hypothetical protein
LNSALTAAGVKLGGGDMILAIRYQKGKSRKPGNDLFPGFRSLEALQQFLEHEAAGDNTLGSLECADKQPNRGYVGRLIPAQKQGPYARIDEQAQRRDRSDLWS